MSKLAGVTIDDWKLPIFKKHLDAAGYKYNKPVQFTANTLILQVHYEWVYELKPIIEAAQRECAEKKGAQETSVVPDGVRPTTFDPTRSWAEQMNAQKASGGPKLGDPHPPSCACWECNK